MTVTDDPIGQTGEKLVGYMTLALTGAARVAEVLAHRRAQQLRRAEQESRQAAELIRRQQQAELAMVRHQIRETGRPEWWAAATPEQVADAYATARAYGRIDPEVAGLARNMEEEIGRRYGVDAGTLVGDVERQAAARREAAARQEEYGAGHHREDRVDARLEDEAARVNYAMTERYGPQWADRDDLPASAETEVRAELGLADVPSPAQIRADWEARAQARAEAVTAVALVAEADAVDAAVHADGKVDAHEAAHDVPFVESGWDDAARRETLASRLETAGVPQDAAIARTIADRLQGAPAAQAAATPATQKAPKARNVPHRGAERSRGR